MSAVTDPQNPRGRNVIAGESTPGDSALDHTPNEHLEIEEYWKAVRVIEQVLNRLTLSG